MRPLEALEVLKAAEHPSLGPAVLATVVSLDGSVYSRAGAMALLGPAGRRGPSLIPFMDLPEGLRREAEAASGGARLAAVDLAEDDPLLGLGLGAPGRVEIFLEPVGPALLAVLRALRESLAAGKGGVLALDIAGEDAGRRVLHAPEDELVRECFAERSPELIEAREKGSVRRTFLSPFQPMGKVFIFGAGADALALARHLCGMGFRVLAADPRPGLLDGSEWESSGATLVAGGWEQARQTLQPDEESAVVVMTRSYALDLETLQGALKSPARYVGLAGDPKRSERMLAELAVLEVRPRPGAFFAPAGLDVGAEAAPETALAIAAELLAVRAGRAGGRPALRRRAASAHAKPKVAGLILAAGRSRRFKGGSKLLAVLEGRAVLRHTVENALASRLDPVIVVLGCDADAGLKAIQGLSDPRLRVVFNPLWEGGKASSIEVGLREVPFTAPAVVSLLGDMPMVKPWLIDRVISEFELSGRLTFPVYAGPDGPTRGYPTAYPRSLFGEIRALTGDDSAAAAVREHWSEAVHIPLDDVSTQADVDTEQDLELLLGARANPQSH